MKRNLQHEFFFVPAADEKCTHEEVGALLTHYALGGLTPSQRQLVEHHLCECVRCSLELPNIRLFNELVDCSEEELITG